MLQVVLHLRSPRVKPSSVTGENPFKGIVGQPFHRAHLLRPRVPTIISEPYPLADDFLVIPVPGHTQGHTVLLYNQTFLFTGDHLAYSVRLGHLTGFRDYCWYSWPQQVRSMEQLADYSFEWILPGHGRRFHAERSEMKHHLQHCIDWMKSVA